MKLNKAQRKLWDKARLYRILNKTSPCCTTCKRYPSNLFWTRKGCKFITKNPILICFEQIGKKTGYYLAEPGVDNWAFRLCERYFDKTE